MAQLRLDGLTKAFGRTVLAVDDLTLEVADGELVAVLGPSGCGKSTVLRMVAGLEEPTRGEVWIDARQVTDDPPGRRNLAMVFQGASIFPHLTVAANLGFGLRVRGRPRREVRSRVAEVAELLQIGDLLDRKPDQISGGERQRVAIGRALLRDADAFLLDEPLSGLDAQIRLQLRTELARLHRRMETTMLYVTHDQSEALSLADRVAVMDGGRLVQVGTPLELYSAPADRFVAGFVGTPPMHFVDAHVEDGALLVVGHRVPLPPAARSAIPPGPVVLGLRAGDVGVVGAPSAAAEVEAPVLPATVVSDEPLGDDRILACELVTPRAPEGRAGDVVVAARVARRSPIRPGDAVGLVVDPTRLYLFRATDGGALLTQGAHSG